MSTTATTTTTTTTTPTTTLQTQIARQLSVEGAVVRGRSSSPRPSILPERVAESSPPERTVPIALSTFISFIDIPVTPYLEWEKKLKEKVFKILGERFFTEEEIPSIVEAAYSSSFTDSNIPSRVKKAVELFSKVHPFPFPFLYDFSQEVDPSAFWEKYQIVQKEEVEILDQVMGGEEALELLHAAGRDKEGLMIQLMTQVSEIVPIERKRMELLRSKFFFKKGFERCSIGVLCFNRSIAPFPIHFLDAEAFSRTFVSFYGEGPFSEKAIRLGGKNLIIPNYAELGIPQEERENYFLEWMIGHLQEEMHIQSPLSPKEQRELFQERITIDSKSGEGKKLHSNIAECLKKTFSKSSSPDRFRIGSAPKLRDSQIEEGLGIEALPKFFEFMVEQRSCSDFVEQMKIYESEISLYIAHHPDFKSKNWKDLAGVFMDYYCRIQNLKKKREGIPVLPLLNAMTFDHFSYCFSFFRLVMCPGLYADRFEGYTFKPNSSCITEYEIDPYYVDQLKAFNVVYGSVVKATIWVHWKVCPARLGIINLLHPSDSPIESSNTLSRKSTNARQGLPYSADLHFEKIKFADDCSYEERRIILDQFQLDFTETPWAEFLEKTLV